MTPATTLDEVLALRSENARLRAAVATGLSWLNDLEHMGSIVDQEALSKDIAQLTAALGWVRADEQQEDRK